VPTVSTEPQYGICTDDADNLVDCNPVVLRRCVNNGGCSADHVCRIADVKCDGCRPAAWKFVATGETGSLRLNWQPEELDKDDLLNNAPPKKGDPLSRLNWRF